MTTPADIIRVIREEFLDDVSDAVDADDSALLYKDSFILRQIGEAQRQACHRQDLKHIFDDSTAAICTITLETGTQDYALDSRILRIENIYHAAETQYLVHSTRASLAEHFHDWRNATAGAPRAFFVTGSTLTLDRAPSADEDATTLALSVWRDPLVDPNWNTDFEVVADYEKLGHWVAHRAFMRPDAGNERMALSKLHRDLFDQAFGQEIPAQARRDMLAYPDLSLSPLATMPNATVGNLYRRDFDHAG